MTSLSPICFDFLVADVLLGYSCCYHSFMKIKFTEDVEVEARLDICCFSGECMHRTLTFKAGDELEVSSVSYGPKIKVKTRPGKPGGRLQKCSVCLQNEN